MIETRKLRPVVRAIAVVSVIAVTATSYTVGRDKGFDQGFVTGLDEAYDPRPAAALRDLARAQDLVQSRPELFVEAVTQCEVTSEHVDVADDGTALAINARGGGDEEGATNEEVACLLGAVYDGIDPQAELATELTTLILTDLGQAPGDDPGEALLESFDSTPWDGVTFSWWNEPAKGARIVLAQ